ncbi:MAG: PSD1 and planctomycete cytochrome C domain-containing protein [Pirellulaceae bacterium]
MRRRLMLTVVLLAGVCRPFPAGAADSAAPTAEQSEFFEKQVRPILAAKCQACHGERKQESGLRLDSRAALLAGGDTGEAIASPGEKGKGLLLDVVRRGGDIVMPPDEADRLSEAEVASLDRWIEMGLPWPKASQAEVPLTMRERIDRDRLRHWSLRPITRPTLPTVADPAWAETPVDRFVAARLEAAGLTPSPTADRRTLIRRLSFDLCGLPPTPLQVDAFLADAAPGAVERLVERLLASPRYGERWGRHWLDVARYADTRGYSFGRERRFPYAYTYRDYVVAALNRDKPYDRFLVEQLAADRLGLADNDSNLAALGFLTVGRKYNNQHDDIDDQIDVVGRGLMGLTLACARCHDHKYDGVPTEDYYSLYGVFASCEIPDVLPLIGDPQQTPGYGEFKARLDALRKDLSDFEHTMRDEIADEARRRTTEYLTRVALKQPEELLQKLPFISLDKEDVKPRLLQQWRAFVDRRAKADDVVFGLWRELLAFGDKDFAVEAAAVIDSKSVDDAKCNRLVLEAFRDEMPQSKSDVPRIYGKLLEASYAAWQEAGGGEAATASLSAERRELLDVLLAPGAPTDIAIADLPSYLVRADRNKHRELEKKIDSHEASSPGAPPRAMVLRDKERLYAPRVFLRGNHTRPGDAVPRQFVALLSEDQRQPFSQGSGRLELAQRIVDPRNPLTARVIVNRVWMHHFGQPLVATPSDFGVRSDPPVHIELLDWLAWRLIDSGWSLKSLHREIVLSAAYRQASLDREDCRRVDPENRLWWRMNRKRLEFEPLRDALLVVASRLDTSMGGKPEELFGASATRRRAVYGYIDRQDLPGELRTFDFANPDQSSDGRPQTTVPQQALYLMNSPLVVEQAKSLIARSEVQQAAAADAKIAALYAITLSRPPSEAELQVGRDFVASAAAPAEQGAVKLTPWQQYAQLLLMTNEFLYVD